MNAASHQVAADEWSCTVTDLPKFNEDGTLAHYKAVERPVAGYRQISEKPLGMLVTFAQESFAGVNGNYGKLEKVANTNSSVNASNTIQVNLAQAQKVGFYFLAIMKSYVNHPRFVMNESSNYETMPAMYEYVLMLLDFFNISFILNTPNLDIPAFSEIPSNLKSEVKLIDLWADKQKFVVSTLSELSKAINDKLAKAEDQ